MDNLLPGDILLYKGGNSLSDRIIMQFTHGTFTHCAIYIGGNMMIEAIGTAGVVKSELRKPDNVIPIKYSVGNSNIQWGIAFLQRRVNSQYSYFDILFDGLKAFFPKFMSNSPILIAPSSFDCSHLTVLFLLVAGVKLPDSFILNPAGVSPNDLFKWGMME